MQPGEVTGLEREPVLRPSSVSATQPPETIASSSSATPISETSETRPGRRNRR